MQVSSSAFLADPDGVSPLAAAAQWLEAVAVGPAATGVAVLCVASIGFLMLSGRVEVRRGVTVIVGCFILFGAPWIVGGFREGGEDRDVLPVQIAEAPPGVQLPAEAPPPYDPYAGASVGPR